MNPLCSEENPLSAASKLTSNSGSQPSDIVAPVFGLWPHCNRKAYWKPGILFKPIARFRASESLARVQYP